MYRKMKECNELGDFLGDICHFEVFPLVCTEQLDNLSLSR